MSRILTGQAIGMFGALGLMASAGLLVAGPLNPPAGPVASSYKTLGEVEPRIAINAVNTPGDGNSVYRITQPGSYYLTGNILGVSGKRGIEIANANVVLDLNGFRVQGVAGSLDGVCADVALVAVTIRNGTVTNWGGSGVAMGNSFSCAVIEIATTFNGGSGIESGDDSVVERCAAHQNTGNGIHTGGASVVRGCTMNRNQGLGLSVNGGSTVESCAAELNTGDGIRVSNGASARGCSASENSGNGFVATDSSLIVDCNAFANGVYGIDAGFGVTVSRCRADMNASHGIEFGSYCRIVDNSCRGNGSGAGGAGLYMAPTATRTHIEGNTCVGSSSGIRVEGAGNLVIGNRCTTNTLNYDLAANNRVGAIVTLPLSGAVTGNVGGNSTGADPISNFAF